MVCVVSVPWGLLKVTVCDVEARACSSALSFSSGVLVLSGVGEMDGVGCVGFRGEGVARGDGEVGAVTVGMFAVSVGWVVMSGGLLDFCSASRPPSSPLIPGVVGATAWAALDSVVALSAVA